MGPTPSRYSIVVERVVCVVVVRGAPSIGGVGAAAVAVVEVPVCSIVVVAVSGEPPPQPARTKTAPLIHAEGVGSPGGARSGATARSDEC